MRLRTSLLFVALVLTAAACGSSTSEVPPTAESSSASGTSADLETGSASDEATEAEASPERDPAATLTIGDQRWTFDVLICSISIAEEGQIPAGSSITALNDEFRLALGVNQAGDFADFTDFEFENPAIDFSSGPDTTSIDLEPKSFTGTAEFLDDTDESLDRIPGTFSGTCS